MRRMSIIVLACVLLGLGMPAVTALADGMVLPLPETLSPEYLAVRVHHVTVQIEDGHAVTRVVQEFYNPHDFPVTGRYLFPVPPEAVLSGFEVTVDGQQQDVIHQDAAQTNAALYTVVSQQRDPSLLQYADWESLAFDLSILPGDVRKMTLVYEEMLLPSGGLFRYRYVLSTERYSSHPLEEVSVTVDLRSSAGITSLYSSSHQVAIERLSAGQARVSWEATDTTPSEDFELFFAPAEGGFGAGLLTGERQGQGHFLFLLSPEIEQDRSRQLPKDIVFVLDRSGSMRGDKLEQARNALRYILDELGEEDRFALVSFADQVSVQSYAMQPVVVEARERARRFVEGLSADGGTNVHAALQAALEILLGTQDRGATRMVVFLTDGLPTEGITDEGQIVSSVAHTNSAASARFHVFGVGYDVNTHLLDRLAADNKGTVTYVRPNENLEAALAQFYRQVAHPVLTDLEVAFQGMEVRDLYPQTLPDLFQGSSLLFVGRYEASGKAVSVRVRGWAGGGQREYVYHYRMDKSVSHDFVPRLWATRHVGALLDLVRVNGWSQELEDEIRETGLGYGIVTPYTAFVIEEQAEGAASADNMALYSIPELNQASGRVTVEARLQNQMYQQASRASLASGANLSNYGQHSLAEIGAQQVDLALLQGRDGLDEPITADWLERNLRPDRIVEFGSEEYFTLASDPDARPYLQSGREPIFSYQGEVIAIRDQGQASGGLDREQAQPDRAGAALQGVWLGPVMAKWAALSWALRGLMLLGVLWMLLWLFVGVLVLGHVTRERMT